MRTGWSATEVAKRVAKDLLPGSYVNLGIGMPELVSEHVKDPGAVVFHSENGLLGMGGAAGIGHQDYDLINAGKKCVTILPGGAFFDHAESFAMVRGGHIDVCIMGALQVSGNGDLANWTTGAESDVPAVGGAMDLAIGAREVWVMMSHTTRDGQPKLVHACTYPLTACGVVKRVYTNCAVLIPSAGQAHVVDMAPHLGFEFVQAHTEPRLIPTRDLQTRSS